MIVMASVSLGMRWIAETWGLFSQPVWMDWKWRLTLYPVRVIRASPGLQQLVTNQHRSVACLTWNGVKARVALLEQN